MLNTDNPFTFSRSLKIILLHSLNSLAGEKTVAKNSQSAFHMLFKKMTTQAGG